MNLLPSEVLTWPWGYWECDEATKVPAKDFFLQNLGTLVTRVLPDVKVVIETHRQAPEGINSYPIYVEGMTEGVLLILRLDALYEDLDTEDDECGNLMAALWTIILQTLRMIYAYSYLSPRRLVCYSISRPVNLNLLLDSYVFSSWSERLIVPWAEGKSFLDIGRVTSFVCTDKPRIEGFTDPQRILRSSKVEKHFYQAYWN